MFANFEFLRLNAGLCLKSNIQLHARPNKSVCVQLGGSTSNTTREAMKCEEKVCSKIQEQKNVVDWCQCHTISRLMLRTQIFIIFKDKEKLL